MSAPARSSASVQDYVKVIHAHTEWQAAPITTTALAARLGVTAASASEMVRRLDQRGLVRHRPYRPVELTPAGRSLAVAMIRRHRVLETWLAAELGYGWDEVHDEAERLEHAVSDRLIEAIADRLGDPEHDPHGDPIPRRDGTVAPVNARPLAGFDAGHRVAVRRVSDADPALLRDLAAARIGLGTGLTVGSGLRARLDDGDEVALSAAAVAAVWAVDRGEHPGCTLSQRS
ncbi:DtxR family transcriptional regulator [Tersicoccus phoenicis]|uniref:Manganese transport regulator n=1 Tax=Tersicoccus phoenicis TaxID=554083 RepID=A0A1R1L9L2_9MICC|nr:metal-dependent transcriptional regulator [Tersicoccus phoenicis]OMH24208.1 DtxR family transcriptional regulator [Tersicoccus phoenicis]